MYVCVLCAHVVPRESEEGVVSYHPELRMVVSRLKRRYWDSNLGPLASALNGHTLSPALTFSSPFETRSLYVAM